MFLGTSYEYTPWKWGKIHVPSFAVKSPIPRKPPHVCMCVCVCVCVCVCWGCGNPEIVAHGWKGAFWPNFSFLKIPCGQRGFPLSWETVNVFTDKMRGEGEGWQFPPPPPHPSHTIALVPLAPPLPDAILLVTLVCVTIMTIFLYFPCIFRGWIVRGGVGPLRG